jgi:predicted nucleic acid-binding protein
MIFVDSSVWIDYLRDADSPGVRKLDSLIGGELLATSDLVLAEVLQGTDSERAFQQALMTLRTTQIVRVADEAASVQAARNFRFLRAMGVTVRKTIDTLIATRCILDGHELLHSDRDFDAFEEHLGLRVVTA